MGVGSLGLVSGIVLRAESGSRGSRRLLGVLCKPVNVEIDANYSHQACKKITCVPNHGNCKKVPEQDPVWAYPAEGLTV